MRGCRVGLGWLLPVTLALLFFVCPSAQAQLAEGGARALALGRAATALAGEPSGHFNPASWSSLPGRAADLFASQAYGLSELRLASLAYVEPTRLGAFAASARTYGFEDYRETVLGLGYAYAVPLSSRRVLHVGATVRYTRLTIPDYSASGLLSLSLGTLVEVAPGLQFGAHARNLLRPRSTAADLESSLSTSPGLALGLAYQPTERALVLFSTEKDLGDFPAEVRGGLEITPVPVLALRTGFATAPTRYTAGAGVRTGRLAADLGFELHQQLGLTPAISVGVRW